MYYNGSKQTPFAAAYLRGNVYYKIGEYERSTIDYTTALQLNPQHDGPYAKRGLAYLVMGQREQAIADFRQILGITTHPEVRQMVEELIISLESEP